MSVRYSQWSDSTDRLVSALSDPAAGELRASLAASCGDLPADHRGVMQVLSLVFKPINRSALSKILLELFKGDAARRKALYVKPLTTTLGELEEAGLALCLGDHGLWVCHPLLLEITTREAIEEGVFWPVKKVFDEENLQRRSWYAGSYRADRDEIMRDLRLALHVGDAGEAKLAADELDQHPSGHGLRALGLVAANPYDPGWLSSLPRALQIGISCQVIQHMQWRLGSPGVIARDLAVLGPRPAERWPEDAPLPSAAGLLAAGRLLAGERDVPLDTDKAEPLSLVEADALDGWALTLQGEADEAIARFTSALTALRKATRRRKQVLPGLAGVMHVLALLRRGRPADVGVAGRLAEAGGDLSSHDLFRLYSALQDMIEEVAAAGQESVPDLYTTGAQWREALDEEAAAEPADLALVFKAMVLLWQDPDHARPMLPALGEAASHAARSGLRWVEAEALELISRLDREDAESAARAAALWKELGLRTLCDTVRPSEPWERSLHGLLMVADASRAPRASAAGQRLVWFLTFDQESSSCHLEPRVQKRSKTGRWSKGQRISLKRLHDKREELAFLEDQDRRAASHISDDTGPYSQRGSYVLDQPGALLTLCGHPRLFWANNPGRRVEVIAREPELLVSRAGGELRVRFVPEIRDIEARVEELRAQIHEYFGYGYSPKERAEYERLREEIKRLERQLPMPGPGDKRLVIVREGQDRLKVIPLAPHHLKVSRLLGPDGLLVPDHAEDRVAEVVSALAPLMPVQSDIASAGAESEAVAAEAKPVALCAPLQDGISVELLARPLGEEGPLYRPGEGGATVLAEVEGRRLETRRDLKQEAERAAGVLDACPALTRAERRDGAWMMPVAEDALQALLELGELGDRVSLFWPRGEKLRVRPRTSSSALSLTIRQRRGWFVADGELAVDGGLVLTMQQILALLREHSGTFIPLQGGEFIALTRELRRRLDELAAFSEARPDGTRRFNPLAAPALEALAEEAGSLDADRRFGQQLERMRAAWALEPEPPSTLMATLRDYQREGYRWLARLAAWGVGACLADDMGLGKTVQALALILERSGGGPSLVVAPTSVLMNWEREAARFTPTLKVASLGPGDRAARVASLGPRDLLLCSYGLLSREADLLAEVTWQVAVLDEAQAIKNAATKRARAAMKLQAEMRLATTGTPVENHLLELWTLFRFLNPGLLGSREGFKRRYALPIERDGDAATRRQLKKLIRPFILRRTKDQVLEELPERTEVLRQVTMGEQEAALYEALRQRAVEKLDLKDPAPGGQRQVMVLAEITRLRRACCNPRLVAPEVDAPSAKLAALDELLDELLPGGHKALVFSQFVGHLSLIREHLDARGVAYQYLDGATPEKERRRRVDAFQAGDGELFLISLRAGGLGLNLTAADYVIHMDPWWNPAVEDQASDRAHRIGQRRPVTIYRLVLTGTIEDKIVALHRDKRSLARDLLDGTERANRLSADDLLELLREV